MEVKEKSWRDFISPLRLILLVINAICFGGCLVLLTLGCGSWPLVLLTVGTGLSLFAGLTGVIITARRKSKA